MCTLVHQLAFTEAQGHPITAANGAIINKVAGRMVAATTSSIKRLDNIYASQASSSRTPAVSASSNTSLFIKSYTSSALQPSRKRSQLENELQLATKSRLVRQKTMQAMHQQLNGKDQLITQLQQQLKDQEVQLQQQLKDQQRAACKQLKQVAEAVSRAQEVSGVRTELETKQKRITQLQQQLKAQEVLLQQKSQALEAAVRKQRHLSAQLESQPDRQQIHINCLKEQLSGLKDKLAVQEQQFKNQQHLLQDYLQDKMQLSAENARLRAQVAALDKKENPIIQPAKQSSYPGLQQPAWFNDLPATPSCDAGDMTAAHAPAAAATDRTAAISSITVQPSTDVTAEAASSASRPALEPADHVVHPDIPPIAEHITRSASSSSSSSSNDSSSNDSSSNGSSSNDGSSNDGSCNDADNSSSSCILDHWWPIAAVSASGKSSLLHSLWPSSSAAAAAGAAAAPAVTTPLKGSVSSSSEAYSTWWSSLAAAATTAVTTITADVANSSNQGDSSYWWPASEDAAYAAASCALYIM